MKFRRIVRDFQGIATLCVDYVVTDLALLRCDKDWLVLDEVAPGLTPARCLHLPRWKSPQCRT